MPGHAGGWIAVRDAVKKPLPKDAPVPGKFRVHEPRPTPPRRRSAEGRVTVMKFDMTSIDGIGRRLARARRRDLRPRAARRSHRAHGALAARQAPAPATTRRSAAPTSTAPARRCTSRRAPAAPVTARRACRSSAAAVAPWARSCAATSTTCRRRCARWRCAMRSRPRFAPAGSSCGRSAELAEGKTKALRESFAKASLDERAHHRRRRGEREVRRSPRATCRRSTCCRSRASTSTTSCAARSSC